VASTNPAPPDSDLSAKIVEVVEALGRFGELAAELKLMFQTTRLAQLTLEHKANVSRAKRVADRRWLGDHEMRLRESERLQGELRAALDAERTEREALRTEIDALKATAAE
jgi:hypothetical protein